MFVDIHSHIIPGIDDGAQDQEMALNMLKIAAENGTEHIVATPHYIPGSTQNSPTNIVDKCNEFQQQSHREGISLKIYSGCEIFISPDINTLFENGKINTLNNTAYMLIEFPMMSIPPYTDSVLYELQLKGIIPVIAHPERNSEIMKDPDILRKMLERGMFAQGNSGSITGIYGKKAQNTIMKLIKEGMVHFIASDAHTNKGRSPNLSKAAAIVEQKYGYETMKNLFETNGMNLLLNKEISRISPKINKKICTFIKVITSKITTKN